MSDKQNPIDDGGPAFPGDDGGFGVNPAGMSLRDWFAGRAMGRMAQAEGICTDAATVTPNEVADCAYRYADAMLKRGAEVPDA